MKNLNNEKILAISLIVIAVIFRMFPILPNFQPIMGIALFAGFIFSQNSKLAFIIPISAMLISDIFLELFSSSLFGYQIGFHNTILFVYFAFFLVTLQGKFFINNNKFLPILLNSLAGSILFFIITNFGSWLFGLSIENIPYDKSFAGLVHCYIAAIPFYKNTLISSVLFSVVLFGAYSYGEKLILKSSKVKN